MDAGRRSIKVETANRQSRAVNAARLARAVRRVLKTEDAAPAVVSLAIVDDGTMHQLNRRYLDHDYPTDVLSFLLSEDDEEPLQGEIVVSADTAAAEAERYGWSLDDELLLYVIHGALHLVGYDDHAPRDRREMRDWERYHLSSFGLSPRYDEAEAADEEGDAA
jgi:probable rRNA maturation factor